MESSEENASNTKDQGKAKELKVLFASLMAKEKELFTTGEVMRLFKVSASSVYRWRQEQVLPFLKMGGTYYYSKNVLCSFMARKMQSSVTPIKSGNR